MAQGCDLKKYGCRTMNGNWWEERITLHSHLAPKPEYGKQKTIDMDVDEHVRSYEPSPKWAQDLPSVKETTYQAFADPALLEGKTQKLRMIRTAEGRRRLEDTSTLATVSRPGSTMTAAFLSHLFIDPHKMPNETIYTKNYSKARIRGNHEPSPFSAFYSTLGSRGTDRPIPERPDTPRRLATEGSWVPGWGMKVY
jgi:hypothetical protein